MHKRIEECTTKLPRSRSDIPDSANLQFAGRQIRTETLLSTLQVEDWTPRDLNVCIFVASVRTLCILKLLCCKALKKQRVNMAKLRIYGSKVSVSTRRVLLVLKEKAIDYDFVAINTGKGEQKVRPASTQGLQ